MARVMIVEEVGLGEMEYAVKVARCMCRGSVLKSGSVWFFDLKMRQLDPNQS